METLTPIDPEAGGYEAEADHVCSLFEEPVDPPWLATDHEKEEMTKAGIAFCWWCGSFDTLIGFVGLTVLTEEWEVIDWTSQLVLKPRTQYRRACKLHIGNLTDWMNEVT